MKKHGENVIYKMGQRSSNQTGVWWRSVCAILCVVFVLVACVGCDSYASSAEIATLNAKLNDAVEKYDSLKKSYEAAQQEIDALKNGVEAAQSQLTAIQNSNEIANQEIGSLKSGNQAAQNKIASLTESVQAAQERIASLTESIQAAQETIASLTASDQAAAQEIAALKAAQGAMQQEIDSLKRDNEAALQGIEQLKEQIQELGNGTTPNEPGEPSEPTEKIKIYIDQGHNPTSYHGSGAEGNGLYEQDLTFTIGILLSELLEEDGRFEICLSRPTETTVLGTDSDSSLDARVQGATDFRADYFISLHVNSFTSSSATGIEVYTVEPSGVSYDFGSALLRGLIQSTGLNNRGMKQKDFRVIKNATMPAALLEMGFISNSDDAALLSKEPELFAQGIYNGILDYFDLPTVDASAN